ncbi:MAG TPA: asparagine synthase (glutamine-hydrolyzing) [Candidatus Paceibacterota bacterium]|nr:asparagine synthase (glutamine-hydrolyzing) [Candidatus Paceibacterota bacterium]
MCGITGVYHFNNDEKTTKETVDKMRDTLAHRGPDGKGTFVSKDKKVGLGHRRLSIIDLSEKGAQPMTDEKEEIQIVYNGEVYNFKEIRKDLKNLGYDFKSETDTEVIMKSYQEWGVDCVKKFNGMFAFAIWDKEKERIFTARDHVGIKPFYYSVENGTFLFGSEIKAVLANPGFEKRFAEENVSYYLTFASLPAPYTLFESVKKLPAAHWMIVDKNGVQQKEYWNPLENNRYPKDESEEYYVNEIRRILKDSIEKQMVSDVPFGCFLSGGIDSSTNAALMSEALGEPVETFTIAARGYGEKYNELNYARKIVDMLGAKSHEITVNHDDLIKFLPKYAKYFDDPNGDQIDFLVYYISKLIKDSGVIVAQVGEGSDEIFAGYDSYILAVNLYNKIWKYAEKMPKFLKKIPHGILKLFSSPKFDFAKEYARRLKDEQKPYWGNAVPFAPTDKEKLFKKEYKEKLKKNHEYKEIESYYQDVIKIDPKADFLEKMMYLELKMRLPEVLLMRADKMAMAHSVETRVPFLDKRLIELAIRIPQSLKIKNGNGKRMLKKAVKGIIPDEIINREKKGFSGPMSEWLKKPETAKPLTDKIFNSKLRERDIINYDYVKKLIKNHQKGLVDNNFKIWNLISLSLWYDEWFGN